jgi:hypothetical protein
MVGGSGDGPVESIKNETGFDMPTEDSATGNKITTGGSGSGGDENVVASVQPAPELSKVDRSQAADLSRDEDKGAEGGLQLSTPKKEPPSESEISEDSGNESEDLDIPDIPGTVQVLFQQNLHIFF